MFHCCYTKNARLDNEVFCFFVYVYVCVFVSRLTLNIHVLLLTDQVGEMICSVMLYLSPLDN